jgi:putative Holliday junction resolvase
MKVVTVDYGKKRLGVAVGFNGTILFTKTLFALNKKQALADLIKFVRKEEAKEVVFGLPLRLDGGEKEEAIEVRRFANQLSRSLKLPVSFIDERLTSFEAKQILREQGLSEKEMRGVIDEAVARLLLTQYYQKKEN